MYVVGKIIALGSSVYGGVRWVIIGILACGVVMVQKPVVGVKFGRNFVTKWQSGVEEANAGVLCGPRSLGHGGFHHGGSEVGGGIAAWCNVGVYLSLLLLNISRQGRYWTDLATNCGSKMFTIAPSDAFAHLAIINLDTIPFQWSHYCHGRKNRYC